MVPAQSHKLNDAGSNPACATQRRGWGLDSLHSFRSTGAKAMNSGYGPDGANRRRLMAKYKPRM